MAGADLLHLPQHYHVHQLLPILTQQPVFFFVRAPQQRHADPALTDGDGAAALHRDPEYPRQLVAHIGLLPALATDPDEGSDADEGGFQRFALRIDRDRLELYAEIGEVLLRSAARAGAQLPLDQLADPALVPPEIPWHRDAGRRCELSQSEARHGVGARQQFLL